MMSQIGPSPRNIANRRPAGRRGFSLLELTVALILLGVAVSGLFPVLVAQSRCLRAMEKHYPIASEAWYLKPSDDSWARKLGAAASLAAEEPAPEPADPDLLIDDGDATYEQNGTNWAETTGGYENDIRRHPESATPT